MIYYVYIVDVFVALIKTITPKNCYFSHTFLTSCIYYCNSMPLGAAWAYYIKILVLASTAL